MSKEKKTLQLGMNPSTASNRLVKDLLFHYAVSESTCYRCGEKMTRDDFSIEHKVPWLDSEDPVSLYFDLDNISFSHLECNRMASRGKPKSPCGTESAYSSGCRCNDCRSAHSEYARINYSSEYRRARYKKNGA